MDNLESRIGALEASNRRQRYSITALAAVIVGGTFIAATRPASDATFDTVTCKAWNVVDNDKVRIGAKAAADGTAGVTWFDNNSKGRIFAGTTASGKSAIVWLDTNEKSRISAHTQPDGTALMQWTDKDGKPRILAGTGGTEGTILPTTDLKPQP